MIKLNVETTQALIKSFEGFSSKPYYCPTGHLTVGYGHLTDNKKSITKDDAELFLAWDIDKIRKAIESSIKVPLNENQTAVIVSFVFNVGVSAFVNSTLLKKLNQGDYDSVPSELKRWNKGTINGSKVVIQGLVNRREKESELWVK